jgi:uncharacterized protein (DUF1778 family)
MPSKRTLQIGIRIAPEDLEKLVKAADLAWPGAKLSQSSAILSLALREADRVLQESPTRKGRTKR